MKKPKIPVFYEIDENGANGIVHPFCSESCRLTAKPAMLADFQSRGFTLAEGMDNGCDSQCRCEQCGHHAYRV